MEDVTTTQALRMLMTAELQPSERSALIARLRGDPNSARALAGYADDQDLDLRTKVPFVAEELLGRDALPILRGMINDRDPDIRGIVVDVLLKIDPTYLARLLPALRRRLRSANDSEAISSAWQLARAGDASALSDIERLRNSFPPRYWQHKAAEIILVFLTDPEAIPARISAHDHDHMMWLAHAAATRPTPKCVAALEDCMRSAPDTECQTICRKALARIQPS